MVDATTVHAWLVAQALLGLSHPQTHPAMASTI
jgi:hypothetical protein